jgi:2-polyprenyl-6-methoxyphenol hydroxylase-like FAD-dependent oxidoreductase
MEHEAVGLINDGDVIGGVQVQTPAGPRQVRADLVIGCDGRHSVIRHAAHLEVIEEGVPIDVLWFRVGRSSGDPEQLFGNINYGRALVLISRDTYFQAGLIIRKGSFEEIKACGLESFRDTVRRIAPYLGDRLEEVKDWDQIRLLSVQINRLRQWYRPGLLCIGDAAHAMSPAGGIGINLAIQDAVATANLLADPLRERRVTEATLAQVQRRREFPTWATQQLQVLAHKGFAKIFENPGPAQAPWQLRLAFSIPGVQRLTARTIGMGVRPEHVRSVRRQPRDEGSRLIRMAVGIGLMAAGVVAALRMMKRQGQSRRSQSAASSPVEDLA